MFQLPTLKCLYISLVWIFKKHIQFFLEQNNPVLSAYNATKDKRVVPWIQLW